MNEQLPTLRRAALLPERVTKKKPDDDYGDLGDKDDYGMVTGQIEPCITRGFSGESSIFCSWVARKFLY